MDLPLRGQMQKGFKPAYALVSPVGMTPRMMISSAQRTSRLLKGKTVHLMPFETLTNESAGSFTFELCALAVEL